MRWILVAAVVVALGSVAHAQYAAPTAAIYVVDRSMPVEKLEVVTRSLAAAIDQLDPDDRVAVITAGPAASLDVSLQPVTPAAKKTIATAVSRIAWSKRSNLKSALAKASALIAATKGAVRHVVLITDGEPADLDAALRPLRAQRDVKLSRVGYQSTGVGYDAVVATPAELTHLLVGESGSATIEQPLAVVLVLDRSGSMSGAKLEAAKESARMLVEVLAPTDLIAVIAFDVEAQVYVAPQRAASKMKISTDISRIEAGGGTNIYPGLKQALELLQPLGNARKIVILLSDGEAPPDGIAELVQDMRAARITVSAVGLMGADRNLLSMIADAGEGRLYMIENIGALPKIFMTEAARPPRPARP
jgi:Mg-chelatase subunit ChlD